MKKTSIIFLLCLFAFNPLVLFADESKVNSDLEIQIEIDSYEQAHNLTARSGVGVKYFKVINNSNNSLVLQNVETKSDFDNKQGYKHIRTGYFDVITDDIFFPLLLPMLPYDMVFTPCSNLYKRQQLMSIYKYQKGKYKLKPHKSITIAIVPKNWKDGQDDELSISYKKTESSSEIEIFKYQFKYLEEIYMYRKPKVRTYPCEKDCKKDAKTN